MYILFTNWGRIGDTGQYQQTPFPTKEEAVKEFKKIFRAKTGNKWQEVNIFFEVHEKKYRLIPREDRRKGPQLKKLEIDLKKSSRPSQLPEDLQKLMTNLVRRTPVPFFTAEQFAVRLRGERNAVHQCVRLL